MSSPVPAPVMSPPRRRSMAGPVVLIVMGIVFLMATMGVLHGYQLWAIYGKYWPALIILWGVIKLVEHQRARAEGSRSSGIGLGGVFLLLFLIITGSTATKTSNLNWQALHDQFGIDESDLDSMFGESFNYHDELSQAFPDGASLHVVSDRGAIKVVVSDDKQIKVLIDKTVHADDQQKANKINEQTKPLLTMAGQVVTINANTQAAGEHGVTADMTISLPKKAAVVISSRHGDISIATRDGNAEISSQRGDVNVSDLNGNANLNLDHSSAKLSNVSGDVSIDGRANDVSIANVKGSARLNGEFMESVHLSQIAKTVSFRSSRTDMEFAKLDGALDLDSGDLRASSVSGPSRVSTRSKDIRLDGVSGDLRLEDSNGSVEVVVHKLGNVEIDNRSGDIQLSLPMQAAFRVDARAKGGEIQSDFGELNVNNGDKEATATGSVGNGQSTLRLNNEHGTIELRKGTSEASLPPSPPKPGKNLPSPPEPPEPTEN
jgi:putative adhesin/cell wall-active antibiotic response 4TMS protein YvqF